ncbi:MAG: universal stress protein [Pseudomonadota bacterium]
MRTVLIPVADRPECAVALSVAFDLADRLSLDVLGYHMRPHKLEKSKADGKRMDLASKAAHELFDRTTAEHGMALHKRHRYSEDGGQALWRELTGSPEKCFPFIGPMSDLIVVSRPKNAKSVTAHQFQQAALMDTGTPVLMLPSRKPKSIGSRVLICWNQSIEAATAVKATIPLLKSAEAVTIVTSGPEDATGSKSTHLQQYLRHHGIKAKRVATRGIDTESEIRKTYEETDSDLLLMGAYSRPRWRERVFGGFTDYVVNKSSVPAIMLHR